MALSPDGTLLAITSGDYTAQLWATSATWIGHSCELVGRYIGAATPYVHQCA